MKHIAASFALLALTGCTTQQPAWVVEQVRGSCGLAADGGCLSEVLVQMAATSGQEDAKRAALFAMLSLGKPTPAAIAEERELVSKSLCLRPVDDIEAAGELVASSRKIGFQKAISKAGEIHDPEARLQALLSMATMASMDGDNAAVGKALDLLSTDDLNVYLEALQVRLLDLLLEGDLERATELRKVLTKQLVSRAGGEMGIIQVAISYVTAGRRQDADAVLRNASKDFPGLKTPDVARLIKMLADAANGQPPSLQDLLVYSSDEVRLQAYVQLSMFYLRTGQESMARRIAGDMSRFVQKRSFSVDPTNASRALTAVLLVLP